MVKVWRQKSNMDAVNWTPKNGQKSRVTTARQVLGHWCSAPLAWGCRMVWDLTWRNSLTTHGRSPTKWFWAIMNVSIRSPGGARLWVDTKDVKNTCTCQFFAVCLTLFRLEFWPRTFSIGLYEKNLVMSEIVILECNFLSRVLKIILV